MILHCPATQSEMHLPMINMSTLVKLQRDIIGCLFVAAVVDGTNRSPDTTFHLNGIFQLLEGLALLAFHGLKEIPVNLNVFPSNFSGLHDRLVQALRRLISERLVYDDHDLFRQLVEELCELD